MNMINRSELSIKIDWSVKKEKEQEKIAQWM